LASVHVAQGFLLDGAGFAYVNHTQQAGTQVIAHPSLTDATAALCCAACSSPAAATSSFEEKEEKKRVRAKREKKGFSNVK
jgi:hypothetical protein